MSIEGLHHLFHEVAVEDDVVIYAGATILGDGRVALTLDVPGLMTLARNARGRSLGQVA